MKRKACSTAKVIVEGNFEEMESKFLFDVQVFVSTEEIFS